jgi:hypothetical protein
MFNAFPEFLKKRRTRNYLCKTKAAVNKVLQNLAINGFSSGALHGSLSQRLETESWINSVKDIYKYISCDFF